jgi:hypothetical protein
MGAFHATVKDYRNYVFRDRFAFYYHNEFLEFVIRIKVLYYDLCRTQLTM